MNLNKAQQEFVNTLNQPVICIAGAGSGKSTTLVEKIRYMVQDLGVNPNDILLLSFSRNSANDLQKKLKQQGIEGVSANTFHSVCKRICEDNGLSTNIIKPYLVENTFQKLYGEPVMVQDILTWISKQKIAEIPYTSSEENFIFSTEDEISEYRPYFVAFYRAYENLKKENNVIDFDDMLILSKQILSKLPKGNKYGYDYVFVDESQDTNSMQNQLANLLCNTNNISYIGDFKQSIYAFRGAKVSDFIDFPKTHENTRIIHMNTNYRSDKEIVRVSNDFIRNYYEGMSLYSDSVAFSENEGFVDKKRFVSPEQEATWVVDKIEQLVEDGLYNFEDMFILFRINSQSCDVETELRDRDIPYTIKDSSGGFFGMKMISTIMAILRLVEDSEDNVAYTQILDNRVGTPRFLNKYIKDMIIKESFNSEDSYLKISMNLDGLKPFQENILGELYYLIHDIKEMVEEGHKVVDMINLIINKLKINKDVEDTSNSEEELEYKTTCLRKLKKLSENKSLKEFIDFAYSTNIQKKKSKNGVSLMSTHASKGLENKVVFIIGVNEDKFPSSKESNIINEANLMYVALSRAKEQMYITSSKPSIFFKEIDCEEKKGRILG